MATSTKTGWKKVTTRKNPALLGTKGELQVFRERISKTTSHTDDLSSAINFIPPGTNFTVTVIPEAGPSAGLDIAVRGAITESGTYSLLLDDLIDAAASFTAATALYAVSEDAATPRPQMPFYKLFVDGDGAANNDKYLDLFVSFVAP